MPDTLMRQVFDALLPGGSAWAVKESSDLDLMLEALGENWQAVVDDMDILALTRNPYLTPYLSDLEREYGIATDTTLSEVTRRMQLAQLVYQGTSNGSADNLQNALQNAGFDVQVHENSPAVDPDTFLNNIFLMVAGGDNAYAAFIPSGETESTAIAGKTGGQLLVNGRQYIQRPSYIMQASGDIAFAGNGDAIAGRYNDLEQELSTYPIPETGWPFFFFVGGNATRNVDGELTAIEFVNIQIEQKTAFERIILRYKPLHTWAGLMVTYV